MLQAFQFSSSCVHFIGMGGFVCEVSYYRGISRETSRAPYCGGRTSMIQRFLTACNAPRPKSSNFGRRGIQYGVSRSLHVAQIRLESIVSEMFSTWSFPLKDTLRKTYYGDRILSQTYYWYRMKPFTIVILSNTVSLKNKWFRVISHHFFICNV